MMMSWTYRLAAVATLLVGTSAAGQGSAKQTLQPKALQSRVWVNLITKIYHCPGSSYYGNTRQGEYMEEAQARAFGYRAMGRRACPDVVTSERAPLPDPTRASKRMVWVNTETGIYHCPNASDWGMTRRGRYVTESDATASGLKPAAGKKCDVR